MNNAAEPHKAKGQGVDVGIDREGGHLGVRVHDRTRPTSERLIPWRGLEREPEFDKFSHKRAHRGTVQTRAPSYLRARHGPAVVNRREDRRQVVLAGLVVSAPEAS
jgi:hypothetical protein